jgi:hypothetical protein
VKNILIIADGSVAKTFVKRTAIIKGQKNRFYIVYYDDSMLLESKVENFIFYKFDPTSYSKLSGLLRQIDFYEAFLILASKQDFLATYENIRTFSSELPLILLDKWGVKLDDRYIKVIEANDILANHIVNFLPNVPVFAKEIGLGQGEIMEMEIPFTSAYAYKHIGSIEQNRWKIAALYRKQTLHIPQPNMMLLPNDIILAIGNPSVLQSVYRSINQDYGQFPQPYGHNLYCIIDMQRLDENDIESLINDSFILHSKLNNKTLIMRILNPVLSKSYEKLKSYKNANINVLFEFNNKELDDVVKEDIKRYDIGLVLTQNRCFLSNLTLFYDIKKPIFKVSKNGFFNIRKSVILSGNSSSVENISSVIFDVSSQLNLNITLYEFEGIDEDENKKIVEHFTSLSKLFDKDVNIIKLSKNPILELKKINDYLQFVRFDKKLTQINLVEKFLSTQLEDHFLRLSNAYQIFIPS